MNRLSQVADPELARPFHSRLVQTFAANGVSASYELGQASGGSAFTNNSSGETASAMWYLIKSLMT